jgi:hypothetical protein
MFPTVLVVRAARGGAGGGAGRVGGRRAGSSKAGLAAAAAASAFATRGRGGVCTSSREAGADTLDMFVDQKKELN